MTIHQKNEYQRLDAPFAEKKKDIDNGDVVVFMEESKTQPNRFDATKDQKVIKIKTKNGARYVNLNEKSTNILIDEFKSNDDKNWIGKMAKVLLNPTVIGGKKVIVAYLVGTNWELDEYGEPVLPGKQEEPAEEIPTINIEEEDAISPDQVPF